jgi:hypothetical protein
VQRSPARITPPGTPRTPPATPDLIHDDWGWKPWDSFDVGSVGYCLVKGVWPKPQGEETQAAWNTPAGRSYYERCRTQRYFREWLADRASFDKFLDDGLKAMRAALGDLNPNFGR